MADDTPTVAEAKLEILRWVAAASAYPNEDFSEQADAAIDALIAAVRAEAIACIQEEQDALPLQPNDPFYRGLVQAEIAVRRLL